MSNLPFRPIDGQSIRGLPTLRVAVAGQQDVGEQQKAELVNRFAGSLRQYYHTQAQNAQLSGLSQWSSSIDRGDHRIAYLRQFGNEVLTLTVSAEATSTAGKPVPWDWAVIDFDLPMEPYFYHNSETTELVGGFQGIYARCVIPPIDPETDDYEYEYAAAGLPEGGADGRSKWSKEGLVVDPYDESGWRPFVSWALDYDYLEPMVPHPSGNIDRRSLRLDLRGYPTTEVLHFEIYGARFVFQDAIPVTTKRQAARLSINLASVPNYKLRVQTGYDVDDLYVYYPEVAAFSGVSVTTEMASDALSEVGVPLFGATEAEAQAYNLVAGNYPTWGTVGQYFFENTTHGPHWSLFTLTEGLTLPAYQALFSPAVLGEVSYPVGLPDFGRGIYKWVDTEWNYDDGSGGLPDGPWVNGVISDPPPGPAYQGTSPDTWTVFSANVQWEWLIFLPKTTAGSLEPIEAPDGLTVSAVMFRGTPPWVERRYRWPFDNSASISQWEIAGSSSRFGLGAIHSGLSVPYFDEALDDTEHVPQVHHEGLAYLGLLIVSPTKGYTSFEPA